MGRLKLRRVLSIGLVLILFLSLFASAVGVAALVRNYLWKRGERESRAVVTAVQKMLRNRGEGRGQTPFGRQRRPLIRNLQRLNRGPSQLLLVKDGAIILGAEEEERDWSGIQHKLKPGLHRVEYEEQQWQVLMEPVDGPTADSVAVIRPWSPSQRLVRTLILYQVAASILVLGLAFAAIGIFSRRLAMPLEELRERTKVVGDGGLEEMETSSVAEIAELQTSFVEMSQRVEEAMTSQRRFVADASHELKTPLTAISGMLELLRDRPEMTEDDRTKALRVATKEADRMATLIADLLLLSRAQAGRSGARKTIQVTDLVAEQLETLRVLFPEQVFELQGHENVELTINPGAFSRIVRNLLENAAHYADSKPIRVVVENTVDGQVRFSVVDKGPGIPKEKLENLFERFYRTDGGRARAEGGHGLGLAIVKALVEEFDGQISCRSEVGAGSEFQVLFRKP